MGNLVSSQSAFHPFATATAASLASESATTCGCPVTPKEEQETKLRHEWRSLTTEEAERANNEEASLLFSDALREENLDRNRYFGVFALDSTRVRLRSNRPGEDDYINANFVDGILPRQYIATQAPLPHTFNDFWRMVWEQNVSILVCLTRLIEGGKHKADRYWPCGKRPRRYGDITVQMESSKMTECQYKIKTFTMQRGCETRIVKQMHFLAWPDHGVPANPAPLLHLVYTVEKEHRELMTQFPPEVEHSPVLVHCSAGIGRTGTFIVVDTVLRKLRENPQLKLQDIALRAIVAKVRQQRAGALTQLCQYLFCWHAVETALKYNPSLSDPDSAVLEWTPEYCTDEEDLVCGSETECDSSSWD